MLKFGRQTCPSRDIVKEIEKTRKLGFDFVEVGFEPPNGIPALKKMSAEIKKSLRSFSYPPIAHTSWWHDISSSYEEVRRAWIEVAKQEIDLASSMGIPLLNFHFYVPGNHIFNDRDENARIARNFISSLNEISSYAQKKSVTIMLENTFENFHLYRYVLERCPDVRVHLDIGHAFISGGMPTIRKFFSVFNGRIAHMHIHDNRGEHDEHLTLGKGKIKWKDVARLLKRFGYDKTVTFEVFTSQKDLVNSIKYFKKIYSS